MFWHVSGRPSIHPSIRLSTPGGGGYPSQVQVGGYLARFRQGGYPARSRQGVPHVRHPPPWTWLEGYLTGYPMGVPNVRYPLWNLAGGYPMGYPTSGTPCQTWPGGYPMGVPHLRYPLSDLAGVRVPNQGGGTWLGGGVYPLRLTDVVFDTPQSVCLLRSRRRTFLFHRCFHYSCTRVVQLAQVYSKANKLQLQTVFVDFALC